MDKSLRGMMAGLRLEALQTRAAHARAKRALENTHMQTHQEHENKQEDAKYETLGEPHVERVGQSGFVEVAHKRATLSDGRTRDFVLIARGYVTRAGRRVTKSLVTLPAEVAPAVARVLAPGGAELGSARARLLEAGAW